MSGATYPKLISNPHAAVAFICGGAEFEEIADRLRVSDDMRLVWWHVVSGAALTCRALESGKAEEMSKLEVWVDGVTNF